jgi:putative PIN family toxin of toxin-antitoxin system
VRIVLDTNVVISALLWRGEPFHLFQAIRQNEHAQLFTSAALLQEMAEVLTRTTLAKRLALINLTARNALAAYINAVELVRPIFIPAVVTADPDDDQVVAAAVAAQADLLVTGDHDLLALGSYRGIRIVSPVEAVGILTGRS